MRLVFFGTPPFAARILNALVEQGYEIAAVVTRPDKPRKRSSKPLPSAVKTLALEQFPNIPLYQPEKASTEEFVQILKALTPDLFVVVAYGEIIKTNLLEIPKKMSINVHASILPKYRGAAPIQRAIMNGEKETGITIMEMVLKMDAGDILEISKTPIGEDTTFGELEENLCNLAIPSLINVLKKIEAGTIQKIPQNHSEATVASKISLEDREINWKKGAEEIHNQIRALSPQPGAFCFVKLGEEIKRLSIKRAKKEPQLNGRPGETLVNEKNEWVVACGQGALSLLEVQLEGKKSLPINAFFRGISQPILIKI